MGLRSGGNMELNTISKSGPWDAKVILVIETTSTKGSGTKEDPVKLVKQYWSLKGELLAESK